MVIGQCVDENDGHSQLLLLTKEILEIVYSTKIRLQTFQVLEVKIEEYLTLLTEKFSNCLKAKHYFLLHYALAMCMVGPLRNICCMRFKSKNRKGNQISHPAICRVNIYKTNTLRHQLIMIYGFLCKNSDYSLYIADSIRSASIQNIPAISSFIHLWPKHLNEKVNSTASSTGATQ